MNACLQEFLVSLNLLQQTPCVGVQWTDSRAAMPLLSPNLPLRLCELRGLGKSRMRLFSPVRWAMKSTFSTLAVTDAGREQRSSLLTKRVSLFDLTVSNSSCNLKVACCTSPRVFQPRQSLPYGLQHAPCVPRWLKPLLKALAGFKRAYTRSRHSVNTTVLLYSHCLLDCLFSLNKPALLPFDTTAQRPSLCCMLTSS